MSRGAIGGDLGWWLEARFGMFVHFGLYSSLARHEWVMSREETAPEDYERYVRYFDPDLYDPREWARAATDAGMLDEKSEAKGERKDDANPGLQVPSSLHSKLFVVPDQRFVEL